MPSRQVSSSRPSCWRAAEPSIGAIRSVASGPTSSPCSSRPLPAWPASRRQRAQPGLEQLVRPQQLLLVEQPGGLSCSQAVCVPLACSGSIQSASAMPSCQKSTASRGAAVRNSAQACCQVWAIASSVDCSAWRVSSPKPCIGSTPERCRRSMSRAMRCCSRPWSATRGQCRIWAAISWWWSRPSTTKASMSAASSSRSTKLTPSLSLKKALAGLR